MCQDIQKVLSDFLIFSLPSRLDEWRGKVCHCSLGVFCCCCCCWVSGKKWKMRFFQFQTVSIWLLTCPTENSRRHEPSHKSLHISILHKKQTSISDSSNNEINTKTFPEKSCRFFMRFQLVFPAKKIFWLFNKSTLEPQSLKVHDFLYHCLGSPLKTQDGICFPYCFHHY